MSGIIRKVDELGRIVIPKSWRNELGMTEGCPVNITKVGKSISIAPIKEECIVCGTARNKANFGIIVNDNFICKSCQHVIKGGE